MKAEPAGIRVTLRRRDSRGEQVFDRVLVAVGRRPNASVPGLDRTQVRLDERGFIVVDEQMRTAEPSIFAIGDVVGEPMLAHKASHEGRTAVEVIAGDKAVFEPQAIPAVVFTDPEIAWAGLTETQAQKAGRTVSGREVPVGGVGPRAHARPRRRPDEAADRSGDRAHPRRRPRRAGAGELIAEGVLAIEMGANATDLKLSIHPHPTLTETLMESAEVFFGQATHVYKPKRETVR